MTDPESEWKLSGEFSALLKTEKKKKSWSGQNRPSVCG